MRWLYLYVTHDPRGTLPSDIQPTRADPSPRDPADTALPPIRTGAFARWAASNSIPAQPTAPSAHPIGWRLADQPR